METISNAVSSATTAVSNAIYGTPAAADNETGGVEPVSGQTGKGTVNDPYDKGNDEALNPSTGSTSTTSALSSSSPAHITHDSGSPTVKDLTTRPSGSEHKTSSEHKEPSSTHDTHQTTTLSHDMSSAPTSAPGVTGPGADGQSRPDAGSRPGDIRPTEANENRPNQNVGGFGTAEPSVSADPASGQKPTPKHEGADRPLEEPTGEQKEAIKDEKKEGEKMQKKPSNEEERVEMAEKGELPHDPNDHSGEPMKMHDGPVDKEGEGGETDRKKSVGQEGGQPHGQAKGTGEEWVKTSGFPADGGDFDATKPGAGKEATRLLEEKGIHRDPNERGPVEGSDTKTKGPGTISKLKEKLHIGTGKNLEDKDKS